MRLLIVSKDLGGGAVAAPLARIALDRGDEVTVVSEGLAPREFAKHGVPIFFQGTPNAFDFPYEQAECFLYFSQIWLGKIKPDAVVTTLGSPILLEDCFGKGANMCNIPLILLEDCHGAHVRTTNKPQLVLVVDEYASGLAKLAHPEARVVVVGHPGVPTPEVVRDITDKCLGELRGRDGVGRIYAFVGGDPRATEEQLQLLVSCLKQTSGDWVLIPRFHPKWVDVTDESSRKKWGEIWRDLLAPATSRLRPDTTGNGRDLVASADVAVADYSTLLTTAVCCGKTSIFLQTPKVLASMKNSTGLGVFPLVELGYANLVTEPVDLSRFGPLAMDRLNALCPYDPQKAYEKIKVFLGK